MLFWLTFLQYLPTLPSSEVTSDSPDSQENSQPHTELEVAQLPSPAQPTLGQLSGGLFFPASIAIGVVVLIVVVLFAYRAVYNITPSNEAFVRTGGLLQKKKEVILNGGCLVLPGFHELTRVPLGEISINVDRTDELAVRTKDYLRANMRVTFYVCIQELEDDVRQAANRLSENGKVSEKKIIQALETRADDAIRAAAKQKTLTEIDSDKLGFSQEVENLVINDLKQVGLTLNNIAIAEIEESGNYDENNYFDAQGVRRRTETIQDSIKQKQDVELSTRVEMEQREKEASKQSLTIAKEQEQAKLDQQLEVESLTAQRQREIQESKDQESARTERNRILQQKSVEEEKIQRRQSEQQSQNEADIALEESNKKLKVAQALQKQEAETAEINRQQEINASRFRSQIEVAQAEQESKTSQEEAAITIANKEQERFAAEAERARVESGIDTAKAVEQAERQQRLAAIAAEQEAQKERITEQNVVEIESFRRRRQAEAARQATDLEAESIRTLADANRDQAFAEAEGRRALIEADNMQSDANRTAELIRSLWPELAGQLPEVVKSLAPQPGILGDARIYAFPGASGNGGNGMGDLSKLMLSTSGFSLINTLLEEGKVESLAGQLQQLLSSQGKSPPPAKESKSVNQETDESLSTPEGSKASEDNDSNSR